MATDDSRIPSGSGVISAALAIKAAGYILPAGAGVIAGSLGVSPEPSVEFGVRSAEFSHAASPALPTPRSALRT